MTAMQVLCCKSEVVRDLMSAEEADDAYFAECSANKLKLDKQIPTN